MKRLAYPVFVLLLNLIPLQSSSAADLSQCPKNWNLNLTAGSPGSSAGETPLPKEIQILQKEIGKNFAVRQIAVEVKDEFGVWVNLREEYVTRVRIALHEKPYRIQYSLATKECPEPFLIYAEGIFPPPFNGIKSMSPRDFVSKNLANSSLDFQKINEIELSILACAENMKKAAATSLDGKISTTFGWVTPKCSTTDTYFEVDPVFHQIGCFHLSRDYNFYIKANQLCDVSLTSNGTRLLTFQLKGPVVKNTANKEVDAKSGALTSEEIQLSKMSRTTTINCVKGNTIKKISAVKPKCPAGYKKK